MLKRLDSLGEEYFYQIIENTQAMNIKKHKRLLWSGLCSATVFIVIALAGGIAHSPAAASRMGIIDYVVLAISVQSYVSSAKQKKQKDDK
ncbi:MAG: hypothetical protein LBP24_04265 [Coriobacteriales bacterium]|jgi:hypothetical protein|nr:hypothetical protein [Coriobacteriales bacterium]